MIVNNKNNQIRITFILLFIGCVLCETHNDADLGISGMAVKQLRSLSTEFWTLDRMKAAKEPEMSLPPRNGSTTTRTLPIAHVPTITVSDMSPDPNISMSRAFNSVARVVSTTGRAFWSCDPSVLNSCSASVIPGANSDLIVTAGHCVYDTTKLEWLINCNWVFVPGYSNGYIPYGIWPARYVISSTAWTRSKPDYNYDVAFVTLSPIKGRHIAQVTGTQGISFNAPRNRFTYSFGYPSNINNGETLQSCQGTAFNSRFNPAIYRGLSISNCAMGHGCSGGPWLQRFSTATGVGIVYSVNSFGYSKAPNTMNGPYFDSHVHMLWSSIQNQ